MTERQEMQWLYAKGLELAILIKGKPDDLPDEPFMYDDFIAENYDELVREITRKIIISAKEWKRSD
jgi:hypothetical protein